MPNENQHGTDLSKANEEALASSDSIFAPGSYGSGQKGLQGFFSPPELARLARTIIGDSVAVLDPTAGDGSLLKEFDKPYSYGIELLPDQIENAEGSYNSIRGDLQHVYTLLKLGVHSWDAIVANPPFGLTWQDPTINDGKPTNSTVMTFIYSKRLLSEQGQMIFVAGRDRFYRQIAGLPEAKGIYAVVECDDLFEGTTLPCVIAFGIAPSERSAESEGYAIRKEIPINMLDLVSTWVLEERQRALGRWNHVARRTYHARDLPDAFKAVQAEYDKRVEKRLGGRGSKREFDAQLTDGKNVQWLPSAFTQLALRQKGDYHAFNGLNGQSINYFVQNERLWVKLHTYHQGNILTLDPRLESAVEDILGEIRKVICPLYQIKPQQRLGYLTDIEAIRCTKSDPEKGFVQGEFYRLHTQTQTLVTEEDRIVESKKDPGEYEVKRFKTQRKVLAIQVGHWKFLDGDSKASENISYLIAHFHLPDPGEVKSRHPDEIQNAENLCFEIMDEMFLPNSRIWEKKNTAATPYSHRQFQKQDIARLVFKGSGLLSWEQGLGKTLGGALFAEACVRKGAQDARLFITAKDLIPQWQRELERFYGKKATLIKTHGQAKQIASELRKGGTGLYITYYEALSLVGTKKSKASPPIVVKEYTENKIVKGTDRYGYFYWKPPAIIPAGTTLDTHNGCYIDREGYTARDQEGKPIRAEQVPIKGPYDPELPEGARAKHGFIRAKFQEVVKQITSKEVCPQCRADTRNGWNGLYCESEKQDGSKCGYAHYEIRVKPIASILSGTFKHGVIVMDEITMIQGYDSKRSKALRGLRSRHKLGMTGTPIKNFVGQAFWLLWWCLGNGTKRFGYTYEGGYTKFENDFSVVEWVMNAGKKESRKALPEVTNLSMLWHLLASSIIRRRKPDTGEKLVPKFYHRIHVPLGIKQTEQMDKWLKDFPDFFIEKYPEKKLSLCGKDVVAMWAPMIGLNWKLDYAATIPENDPDQEWTGIEDVSNFTPANLRVIELAMALAKMGRKVLVGSNLIATSKWVADQLCEKGVKAVHILDDDGTTANPDQRAKRVYSFQTDDVQVFAAGVNAIRLGHNLDAANAVILHGLDWSYDTLDQFINRVHRLTSTEPVDIYLILPKPEKGDTITSRKWDILEQKAGAADLALDGKLFEKIEEQIDQGQIIRELVARGIQVTDETVDEVDVKEAWEKIPHVDYYEIPEGLIPPHPELPTEFNWTTEHLLGAAELYAQLFQSTTLALPAPIEELVVPEEFELEQNAVEMAEQTPKPSLAFAGFSEAELLGQVADDTKSFDPTLVEDSEAEGVSGAPDDASEAEGLGEPSVDPPTVEPESGDSLAPAADITLTMMQEMIKKMEIMQATIDQLQKDKNG